MVIELARIWRSLGLVAWRDAGNGFAVHCRLNLYGVEAKSARAQAHLQMSGITKLPEEILGQPKGSSFGKG